MLQKPAVSGKPIKANVRIIAASSRSLAELVQAKAFREDLYFRLKVVTLRLPAWPLLRWVLPVLFTLYRKHTDCDRDHPFRTRQQLAGQMIQQAVEACAAAGHKAMLFGDLNDPASEIAKRVREILAGGTKAALDKAVAADLAVAPIGSRAIS